MTDFDVANVVGTITFPQELALDAVGETLHQRNEVTSVTYEPAKNHWLQTRWEPDETYVAFYRSGRCSIAGCDSIKMFEETANRVIAVMQELLKFNVEPSYSVSNIVATNDIGRPLDLEMLAVDLGFEQTEYEPEQFPALIYRSDDYVMLIFASGKLLCTGLTDSTDVSNAFNNIGSRIAKLYA